MTAAHASEVRFGRLERRGMLLGLTGPQLALVGCALVVVVAAGLATGPAGILFSAPIWATCLAVALIPVGGRPFVECLPIAVPWTLRRVLRGHVVLARPNAGEVNHYLVIPGVPVRLRIVADPVTGAALIQAARRRTGTAPLTVVARVRGRGFLLEDAGTQDRRVASWGRLLDALGQLPGVSGVQVLHRGAPGGDVTLRRWWAEQSTPGSPWATRILTELIDGATNAMTLESLVAVSMRPRRGAEVDSLLRSLAEIIEAAELEFTAWLTPPQMLCLVRKAYDPAGESPDLAGGGGPMGVAEAWSHARSDSAFHATYWIAEWPRSATHPGFLRPLLLAPGTHRTFSLIAQPMPTGKALREIRRARAEQVADATTRARTGRLDDEASRAAAVELTRREEDLIAGHGDLRFLGLIAVSAPTLDDLEDACASLESGAAQAGCELRRLVGQQVQAYAAAALPLARMLS